MIVDSSAVICVLRSEAESALMVEAMIDAKSCRMSIANWLEAAMVVDGYGNAAVTNHLDDLLRQVGMQLVPVTVEHATEARRAHQSYGRGNHPAKLNYGDCFAYALAKVTGEPLLFKGNDFSQTDIPSALAV